MINFLIFLVVLFGIILLVQLVRIYELVTVLRGGAKDDEISRSDNKLNANLMLLFLFVFIGGFFYQIYAYKDLMLPISASEHGVDVDQLWDFNMILLSIVFIGTHILLFVFAFKYYFRKEKKAFYFTHSNKLEFIWTIIPAIVLAVIIIYGLMTWNKITGPAPEDALTIEVYGKQFDWTVRYPGDDGALGKSNYRLIEGTNDLGLDVKDENAWDDKLVKNEFHIPVNRAVNMVIRSRDVIHSVYLPHFRVQMNAVPGMSTQFHFIPTITTAQMKEQTKNPEFDYILLCAKICGAAHYNMQMTLIVDTEEDYQKWLASQTVFMPQSEPTAQIAE
ncbi:MAG: cytochrome c oxidase subunit II [Bacteroidetes bacterium]|nr:cytochrome c oxidase subunit II [Bacteroidota bacterium]HET6244770.1 cytochrome c oxidase subunit II [Bacteroidia bacterium]